MAQGVEDNDVPEIAEQRRRSVLWWVELTRGSEGVYRRRENERGGSAALEGSDEDR